MLLPCLPGREAAAISTQPTVRVWLDRRTRMGEPGLVESRGCSAVATGLTGAGSGTVSEKVHFSQ